MSELSSPPITLAVLALAHSLTGAMQQRMLVFAAFYSTTTNDKFLWEIFCACILKLQIIRVRPSKDRPTGEVIGASTKR
jgi:hypothetical protein